MKSTPMVRRSFCALMTLYLSACGTRTTPVPEVSSVPLDTLRGTVHLSGSEGRYHLTFRPLAQRGVVLLGEIGNLFQMLDMEVMIAGQWSPSTAHLFIVEHEQVRLWQNETAHDGILHREKSGDVLELIDGQRLSIGRLPASVANADGKRIILAGDLSAPTRAVVIDPKRPMPQDTGKLPRADIVVDTPLARPLSKP